MNPKTPCNNNIYKSTINGGLQHPSSSNANLNVSAAALSTAAAVAAMSAQQQSHAATTITMQPPQHNNNSRLLSSPTLALPPGTGAPMVAPTTASHKSTISTTTSPFATPLNPGVRLPQHLVMNSINHQFPPTATSALRLTEQQRVPPIFQNMGLRRGKWNPVRSLRIHD